MERDDHSAKWKFTVAVHKKLSSSTYCPAEKVTNYA